MSQSLRVLTIDDDPVVQKFLRVLLRKDFSVTAATSGEDGIAQAKEQRPDVIVLDVEMPGMNGIEALRIIRADHELAAVPVLILSSIFEKTVIAEAMAAGANGYLVKDNKLGDTLIPQLRELLAKPGDGAKPAG